MLAGIVFIYWIWMSHLYLYNNITFVSRVNYILQEVRTGMEAFCFSLIPNLQKPKQFYSCNSHYN